MDISEKILKFAENQKTIDEKLHGDFSQQYQNGYNVGYTEGKTDGYDEGHTAGVADGRTAEWSDFWDEYQSYGKRVSYEYSFRGVCWTDKLFKPKYNLMPTFAASMFQNSKITNLKKILKDCNVTLDTSKCTSLLQMFQGSDIKYIPTIDASKSTNMSYTFGSRAKVIEIDKLIVSETTPFFSTFHYSENLEKLIIEGTIGTNGFNVQWSKKLSHESLMSIINALKDYSKDTSGTTWLVTLGIENIAKLTAEELLLIENKGWTYE